MEQPSPIGPHDATAMPNDDWLEGHALLLALGLTTRGRERQAAEACWGFAKRWPQDARDWEREAVFYSMGAERSGRKTALEWEDYVARRGTSGDIVYALIEDLTALEREIRVLKAQRNA